jgi:hypothetical protein
MTVHLLLVALAEGVGLGPFLLAPAAEVAPGPPLLTLSTGGALDHSWVPGRGEGGEPYMTPCQSYMPRRNPATPSDPCKGLYMRPS